MNVLIKWLHEGRSCRFDAGLKSNFSMKQITVFILMHLLCSDF